MLFDIALILLSITSLTLLVNSIYFRNFAINVSKYYIDIREYNNNIQKNKKRLSI